MSFVCVRLSICVCFFCHGFDRGISRNNENTSSVYRGSGYPFIGKLVIRNSLENHQNGNKREIKGVEKDKWGRREGHGNGSDCCYPQSLKDELKHCEGWQVEQRMMVPGFPQVKFKQCAAERQMTRRITRWINTNVVLSWINLTKAKTYEWINTIYITHLIFKEIWF